MKRKLATLLLIVMFSTALLPTSARAFSGSWGHLTPTSGNSALLDIAYGNSTWVAVGKLGAVVTSADGETWTPRNSGTEWDLRSVTFGNGRFVAVGKEPAFSENGIDWRKATVSIKGTFVSVLFAAGKFTAATDQGQVYDSTDGSTWTLAKSFNSSPFQQPPKFQSVTYANGSYFLMDASGRQYQYGARQWESSQGWGSTCSRILYLGGQFLGLCTDMVFTGSSDGRIWNRRDSKTYALLHDAVHDGRRYLAVGENGAVATSPDGINWTQQDKPRQAPDYYAIEYANGLYVVSGDDGRIWNSRDGVSWTQRYSGVAVDLAAVSGARNFWVAVGADGSVMSSPSPWPWKWMRRATGTEQPLRGVTAGADTFVAVGDHGTVITSGDGKTWTKQNSGTDADLQTVLFADGRFVAAGKAGGKTVFLTSVDGRAWKIQQVDLAGIRALTYGQGRFIAVGAGGVIVTSPDGAAWTRKDSPSQADLYGVAYGGGRFLAVGGTPGTGVALTSADGSAWSKIQEAGTQPLYGVAYGNGRFFVAGSKGSTGYSTDGVTLHLTPESTTGDLQSVALQGNRLIAVGAAGVIRFWPLPSDTLSTTKVSVDRVKVGAQISVTAVLVDNEGGAQSDRKVTLLQEPALSQIGTETVTTDYKGEAHFELKAVQAGTLTLTAIADDGTRLGQAVTVSVEGPCGQRFPDVSAKHPACMAIEQLAELQVIKGFEDGFRPEQGLTRAELATMLVRALKLPANPVETLKFTDVQGHWAVKAGYLQAAVKAQAFGGMPDGTFQPDASVTRAQLVKVVAAAAKLKATGVPPYADVSVNDWYAGWVNAAGQDRLIGADARHPVFTDRQFQSERPATRAEAAAVLANLLLK